jgi:hypothetical protein
VVEVTSAKTRREDQLKKRSIYAQIVVTKHVLYDPLGEYLRPALQVYRLGPSGYEPMAQDTNGACLSDALGLRLVLESGRLQFEDSRTGQRLLTPSERADVETEARRAAEARVAELEALLHPL